MSENRRHDWLYRSILVAALALIAAPALAAPAADDVPADVREGIEGALKARIGSLLQVKNEQGAITERGAYSKSFRKVDDNTYQVGFHQDSAGPNRLTTKRYLLTVGRDSTGGTWSVVDEELQDTYEGLFRSTAGDERFEQFDSFSIEYEGLTVRAGAGWLYRDLLPGGVQRFVLVAEGLGYGYEPPMEPDRIRYLNLMQEKEKYLVFEPQLASGYCDQATCEQTLNAAFTGLRPALRDDAPALLRRTYDEWLGHVKGERRKSAFSGFLLPLEEGRRRLTLNLATRGEDRFQPFFQVPYIDAERSFGLAYDNFNAEEVTVSAANVGTVLTYYSEETRTAHNSLYDLERRDDFFGRDYDLHSVRGEVEMGVTKAELLIGDLSFDLTTKRPLREVPFQISQIRETESVGREARKPRMSINSIQDGEGRELTYVKTGAVSGLVVLPEEAPAGTNLELRVQFQTTDSIYPLSPSHSYVDRGGWLPFIRFGDFIEDFDLTLRVPKGYTTLGVGRKIEEREEGNATVSRWVPESKVAFPSVIFGKYRSASSKVKATKLDGTEIPVNIYIDKLSMSDMTTYMSGLQRVQIGAENPLARGIAPGALPGYADQAANALNLFREIYQVDYPYDKLDLVNDPVGVIGFFYGQAPGSLIYLGYAVFRAEGALGDMGGSQLTHFGDMVIAHEVAHQWWGSLITNSNFRNYWFVESLAEYSAALYTEATKGRKGYLDHVENWRQEILDADLDFSVQDATQLASDFRDYRAAVYAKGPYMFHIMRSTWGDEIFFDYMREMAQELAGKEIVSRDIQYAAEKALGGDMNWFFDQWLRGVGMPEYTFTYETRETEDGMYMVEGRVDQRILVGEERQPVEGQFFVAVVPVTVDCGAGKEYQKKLVLESPSTPFRFKVPDKPKSVTFNKYGEALALDVIEKRQG